MKYFITLAQHFIFIIVLKKCLHKFMIHANGLKNLLRIVYFSKRSLVKFVLTKKRVGLEKVLNF